MGSEVYNLDPANFVSTLSKYPSYRSLCVLGIFSYSLVLQESRRKVKERERDYKCEMVRRVSETAREIAN